MGDVIPFVRKCILCGTWPMATDEWGIAVCEDCHTEGLRRGQLDDGDMNYEYCPR